MSTPHDPKPTGATPEPADASPDAPASNATGPAAASAVPRRTPIRRNRRAGLRPRVCRKMLARRNLRRNRTPRRYRSPVNGGSRPTRLPGRWAGNPVDRHQPINSPGAATNRRPVVGNSLPGARRPAGNRGAHRRTSSSSGAHRSSRIRRTRAAEHRKTRRAARRSTRRAASTTTHNPAGRSRAVTATTRSRATSPMAPRRRGPGRRCFPSSDSSARSSRCCSAPSCSDRPASFSASSVTPRVSRWANGRRSRRASAWSSASWWGSCSSTET